MSESLMGHYAILRNGEPYKVMHCTENIIEFSVGYLGKEDSESRWTFFKVTDQVAPMTSTLIH